MLVEEKLKRDSLKINKPLVYEKMLKISENIKNGKAMPILQFQYDYRCNFKCEHCCTEKMWQRQLKNRNQRCFTIDRIKELSRQADKYGLTTFVITGGEPLILKDLDAVVEAIDPTKFWIVVDTNGWFLDLAKAKHLKKIGVDKVQLSIDGANSITHDTFRKKSGSWDRCIAATKACYDAGLYVIWQTVIWKGRPKTKEFIRFLELATKYRVGVYATYAKPVGEYENRYDQMVTPEDEKAIEELGKVYNIFTHLTPSYDMDIGCIAVKRMVSITRFGEVMPCPYMHVSLGNVFDEPLETILKRAMTIKYFKNRMGCAAGVDKNFIQKVIEPAWKTEDIPVPMSQVFTKEDYDGPKVA